MNKLIVAILLVAFFFTSCLSLKSLKSTTNIKANDVFILGNNEHGKFTASVNNTSNIDITVWKYPINGGRHSPVTLGPKSNIKIKVEKNTSLRIENSSNDEVVIKLKVHGDLGLSMGYKN